MDLNRSFLNFLLIWLLLLFTPPSVIALTLKSPSYQLQLGNINTSAGTANSTSYKMTQTTGQLAPGKYVGSNYIVKAGFQYYYSIIPFSFSISKTNIDFQTLQPQQPKTDNLTLTISNGSAYGYQVLVKENHPLQNPQTGDQIPDTSCDPGTSCNEYDANLWTQTTSYGFGYNMSGDDVDTSDFINSDYYRPFPSLSQDEEGAVVMSSSNVGRNRQATMTLKINISSTQAAGKYTNQLIFIAVPAT